MEQEHRMVLERRSRSNSADRPSISSHHRKKTQLSTKVARKTIIRPPRVVFQEGKREKGTAALILGDR